MAQRVAIIGGGVSGCSCAWHLLQCTKRPISVTLFEMGRSVGGRTSTRHSRELPGLGINHGAPLFHLRHVNSTVSPLMAALKEANKVIQWQGTFGSVDATSGTCGLGFASRGEPVEQEAFERYIGNPGMSSLADGILKLPGMESLDARYGIKVASFRPRADGVATGWELQDKDGKALGDFDWIVLTSATIAHPRWRLTWGEDPPMEVAARAVGLEQLLSAVDKIQKLQFSGAHVAMLVWEMSDDAAGPVSAALAKLPFDITKVTGHDVLAKVVRQSLQPPYAAVVLHSTEAFTSQHISTAGAQSTVTQLGVVSGTPDSEAAVVGVMHTAFNQLLTGQLGASAVPPPTWGPVLHRWGAAFPQGDSSDESQSAWVIPQARVVFAGDYLAAPYACVETAMSSGLMAAQEILQVGTH